MTMLMAKALLAAHRWIVFHLYALKMRFVLRQYSNGWKWALRSIEAGANPQDLLDRIAFGVLCKHRSEEFIRGASSACKNKMAL